MLKFIWLNCLYYFFPAWWQCMAYKSYRIIFRQTKWIPSSRYWEICCYTKWRDWIQSWSSLFQLKNGNTYCNQKKNINQITYTTTDWIWNRAYELKEYNSMAGRPKCSHHLGISIYQKNGFKRHISDVEYPQWILKSFF